MYLCVYGLGRYFRANLLNAVKASPVYTISFDESLNDKIQEFQMDVIVRFWNTKTLRVESRYLDSRFIRRPNAKNLSENIVAAVADLDEANRVSFIFIDPLITPSDNLLYFCVWMYDLSAKSTI